MSAGKFEDLTGHVFGKLTVLGRSKRIGRVFWVCQCGCPSKTKTVVPTNTLTAGRTRSCGCEIAKSCQNANIKHGHVANRKRTLAYRTWINVKTRCNNPNSEAYKKYGAKGVTLYKKWNDSFEEFEAYVSKLPGYPKEGSAFAGRLTLDRKNNQKGYVPGNLRWATGKEQARNRSNNVKVPYKGKIWVLADLVEQRAVVSYGVVHKRLNNGWGVEKALLTPSQLKS